jgi:hypothetical protein
MNLEQVFLNKLPLLHQRSGQLIQIGNMVAHYFHELTTFHIFTLKGQCRG